ncbi:MAG TPA: UdgX family uracil-DNA binding protein [Woeseiaceae bacterium]|nr:UdgX family uracil-DNA binding protein [Woeseiaceae bacterium]
MARVSSAEPIPVIPDQRPQSVDACRRCELWKPATQGVPGEGPKHAPLMLVGEQPGSEEDLAGVPFVGPAGRMLDRALEAAGISRQEVFVTNAVKHFRFRLRGKRRIHQKPSVGQVEQCRWWLAKELEKIEPAVVVAMGATAARSVLEKPVLIREARGQSLYAGGIVVRVTIHPSYLLRLRDNREQEFERFAEDLQNAARLARRG